MLVWLADPPPLNPGTNHHHTGLFSIGNFQNASIRSLIESHANFQFPSTNSSHISQSPHATHSLSLCQPPRTAPTCLECVVPGYWQAGHIFRCAPVHDSYLSCCFPNNSCPPQLKITSTGMGFIKRACGSFYYAIQNC